MQDPQRDHKKAMVAGWKNLVAHALHAAFYRNMIVALAHYMHQPWRYLKATAFFKPKPTMSFPPPTVKKDEIKKIIQKQKTCDHMQLGKSTIDGRGTNATTTIKTCRQCLMRWKWQPDNFKNPKGPGKWITVPNPSLEHTVEGDPVRVLPGPAPPTVTRAASSSGYSSQWPPQPPHSSAQMEEDFPQTITHAMNSDEDQESWHMTESEPTVTEEEDF